MTGTTSTPARRALVLGGGGIAGIAWHLGVLSELQAQGIDLESADLVIGTSAGSVAGAILRHGHLAAVYDAQATGTVPFGSTAEGDAASADAAADLADAPAAADPATEPAAAPAPVLDMATFGQQLVDIVAGASGPEDARARLGRAAVAFSNGAVSPLLAQIAAQFPDALGWPNEPFGVCVVRADDGDFRVIDSSDDIPMARAVAASCSVPLVYPPVEIDGVPYVDGGARSATNADVASGYDRVLVLSCGAEDGRSPMGPQLDAAVAALRSDEDHPSDVLVVSADAASLQAFGGNSLDDASRVPSAHAGRAQGAAVAESVRAFWQA